MRRKPRIVIYVCSCIKNNILISKMIESSNIEDASNLFEKEFEIKPEVVLGPFFKKKSNTLNKNFDIKFKFGQNKQGIYNGWQITAMPLLNPENSVYLLYNRRVDGQKMQKPQAMIVKINEIQDLK